MSDTSAFGFGKFVPGFDFLQNLAQTTAKATPAVGGVPGMSSWVAPTLSVEELDKRIQELKAVQFWLEQNGTALKATIQALEVQKMTLSTLQGMNVNIAELAKAFTVKTPESAAAASAPTPEPSPEPTAPAAHESEPEEAPKPEAKARARKVKPSQAAAGTTVDPMQWWGSLTQQFQNIATAAMQDAAGQAMKAQATEASTRAADTGSATRKTAKPPAKKAAAKTARKTATAGKTRASRP